MIKGRLEALRALMAREGMSAYVIPTGDFHLSEYTGDYFKERRFMSGFTGSAGTLVVLKESAHLWTDGRYFIQAAGQLEGSSIELMRQGQKGVPEIDAFLADKLEKGAKVGLDGRMIDAKWGIKLEEKLATKEAVIMWDKNLIDEIWTERPSLPKDKVFILEQRYAGKPMSDKIAMIREKMAEKSADIHVLMSLEDIAWTLNLRGRDVTHTPVFMAYLVITAEKVVLYIDSDKLDEQVSAYLADNDVTLKPYFDIYRDVPEISKDQTVMVDLSKINYAIYKGLKAKTILCENPTLLAKSIKNPVEIENTIKGHIKDGVAVTKFMYWLKKNVGKIPMTEISASDYLENLRREQEGFIDLSFDTICAYQANAAMMHYSATPEHNAELKPEGFLLVDSGGQYYEGTTDITRTFVLGPVTDEMKYHFTKVLRGCLNLQNARFLYGCKGINLDILARGPMWDEDIDYQCGTGHGVGYLLSVHEGPNGFRWKIVPDRNDSAVLEEGMITTDEPGIYLEGRYGIRTENELVCRKGNANEYGQFMYFEPITYVPVDLDGIDIEEMTKTDKKRLNDYHKMVYDTIAPYLTEEEAQWLKEYTKAI